MAGNHRIIPKSTSTLRRLWLSKLGGIDNVSVKNKEWMALLEEDTRNSLMIEGYVVTRAELKNIMEKPIYTPIGHKVMGYFDAAVASYELAFQQHKTNEFALNKAIIRQIHSLMFRGDPHFGYIPGDWRKGPIEISGAKVKPSDPFHIERHIEQLIEVANKPTNDIIRKIAVVHDMFEQIHPFPDGNGRVGRILLNFILVAHGLPNVAIKGTEKNKKVYINALEEADPIVRNVIYVYKTTEPFSHPLVLLEDLINKGLAVAMDVIICNRFGDTKPLQTLAEVAKTTGKSVDSIRVACSQKKYICTMIGRTIKTHTDLFKPPSE